MPEMPVGRLDPQTSEHMYSSAMRDLNRLRESVRDDAELSGSVLDLIREMQRLDPKRFPGNPALVERLQSRVVGGLEQIELQLRRKLDDEGGSVRAGAAEPVPAGYSRSVAEYFRRLSRQ